MYSDDCLLFLIKKVRHHLFLTFRYGTTFMKAILPKKVDFFSAFGEFLFSMLFSYRDIYVTLPVFTVCISCVCHNLSESSFSLILNRSITSFALKTTEFFTLGIIEN